MKTDYDRTNDMMDAFAEILNPAFGHILPSEPWKETEIVIKVHHKGIDNAELYQYADEHIADKLLTEMVTRGHDIQIGGTNVKVITAPFTVE